MKRYSIFLLPLLLAGCVSTQPQADGSTKLTLSMAQVAETLGLPAPQAATQDAQAAQGTTIIKQVPEVPAPPAEPALATTKLAGLYTEHPYDGTSNSYPHVAITVHDWSRNDCWVASAKLWWNAKKSENIAPFSVCWSNSLGFAINNAANLHMFMSQTAFEHSGNRRTTGPKPPMMVIPKKQPIRSDQQDAFAGFIQQLILDTGWEGGGFTSMWIVNYESSAKASK